jgi:hypothetical protein
MLKDVIKKIKKRIKKLLESTRVNCQTCNSGHEIGITSYKEIKIKL